MSDDKTALVERLRQRRVVESSPEDENGFVTLTGVADPDCKEAADTIASLLTEVEGLRAVVKDARTIIAEAVDGEGFTPEIEQRLMDWSDSQALEARR